MHRLWLASQVNSSHGAGPLAHLCTQNRCLWSASASSPTSITSNQPYSLNKHWHCSVSSDQDIVGVACRTHPANDFSLFPPTHHAMHFLLPFLNSPIWWSGRREDAYSHCELWRSIELRLEMAPYADHIAQSVNAWFNGSRMDDKRGSLDWRGGKRRSTDCLISWRVCAISGSSST